MKISYSADFDVKVDALICLVFEDDKILKNYDVKLKNIISDLKKDKIFSGKKDEAEIFMMNSKDGNKQICFVGMGKIKDLKEKNVRDAIAHSTKSMMQSRVQKIAYYFVAEFDEYAQAFGEGIALVNYTPAIYKTGKNKKKADEKLFDEAVIVRKNLNKNLKEKFEKAVLIADAVNFTRDLVNAPANIVTPEYFANEAKKIAKDNKYKITILEKAKLEKLGMGAFLSVNAGSGKNGAKLIILEYKPKGVAAKQPPVMLVGKGLIFDTGGYNLKPTQYISDMQQDKAGGVTVLGAFKLLQKLGIQRSVIGIIPVTENLIDADAQRPEDIVTSYSGQTIEIKNTDAEGRLILADALSYGIEKYQPGEVIDLATLTGACIVALGSQYAGVMGNNQILVDELKRAGDEVDELIWQLPIHEKHREDMKGKLADIRNIDEGYGAGASKAGAFLEFFVGKTRWAHLDIAGTAFAKKPKAIDYSFATGYGVRMLTRFLEKK
ncbi:leucyl aminopeptidase [Patescibacteria group bacterium]|nr:leucyl aminopeptidase [Patescibacteria group bacterium]